MKNIPAGDEEGRKKHLQNLQKKKKVKTRGKIKTVKWRNPFDAMTVERR